MGSPANQTSSNGRAAASAVKRYSLHDPRIVDTEIAGIPCKVYVDHFYEKKGTYNYYEDSDLDYYGYVDMNYTVLDRRGYPAPWLTKKMTTRDISRVESDILAAKDQE